MKRRMFASLLALCMIIGVTAIWNAGAESALAAANYSTVRVKISTAESANISITVGANYRIAQDISIVLVSGNYSVANVSGKIRISNTSGFSKTVGSSLTLERCQSSSVNMITLYNTQYSCSIGYLGNMTFCVQGSGVRAINTVPIEQYLLGVVGYEMSNSFPAEALKAQAIVARGYAISAIAPSSQYDLVDTSGDQVYRGYPSEQENVKTAVAATQGLVVTYGGNICETYFSASNGGQTELPGNAWGGGDSKNAAFPYLAQKTDPYDLENPASLTYRIYVPKVIRNTSMDPVPDLPATGVTYTVQIVNVNRNCSVHATASDSGTKIGVANKDEKFTWIADSGNYYKITFNSTTGYVNKDYAVKTPDASVVPTGSKPALPIVYSDPVLNDLQTQAYVVMKARGDSVPDAKNIRLIGCTDFRNGLHRYTSGNSTCYTSADADLVVQYIDNDGNLADNVLVTATITLVNKVDGSYVQDHAYLNTTCRMRLIESTSDGFDIVCRRFGHGVGLSQRGAQQMALDGKDHVFIVTFYFTGSAITPIDTAIPALPSVIGTPTGKIVQIHCTTTVNIRSQASSTSTVLYKAKNGDQFPHLGQVGSWYIIQYNDRTTAYVSTSYATLITPSPSPSPTVTPTDTISPSPSITPTNAPTPTPTATPVQVVRIKLSSASSYVNVRKTASSSATVLGRALNNETYAYLGKSGSWWKINYKGQIGYVYGTYGVLATVSPTPTPSATPTATVSPTPTPSITPTATTAAIQMVRIKLSSTTSYVNVRAQASTSATRLGTAKNGETYAYLGKSGNWWKINYKGQTGYVYYTYGVLTTTIALASAAPTASAASMVRIKIADTSSYANVRKQASLSAVKLGTVKNGETYAYLGKSGSWWIINYKGQTGYVYETYGILV